jgi:N utilization substance protein A
LKNEFLIAITQVCAERHLPKEVVLDAIEQALVLAYKRNFGTGQNLEVKIDPNTGKAHVFADKEVVEQVEDARLQVTVQEARQVDPSAMVGSTVRVEEPTPKDLAALLRRRPSRSFCNASAKQSARRSMRTGQTAWARMSWAPFAT